MKTTEFIVENSLIAQEAATMHQDHEVQMARADCYNAADYAIQIHRMLKHVSEQEGIEGWVSEKITSANNALRDVAEYLRYEKQDGQEMMEFVYEAAEYALGKLITEESQNSSVAGAIIQRILHQRPDLLKAYGPELVKSAVDNVADYVGDVDEIGSSDVSGWIREVERMLEENPPEAFMNEDNESGWKDWSEKNPGKLNQQTADMYARNTHRWGGDTGVPGAKEHGGKGDLKTIDREGNPVTNRATRIEKPEGVPKVSKIPAGIRSGGGGGRMGLSDPSAVKSLVPNFESKADPTGSWVVYDGNKVKRFKTREGAKAYSEKNGGKVASSEFYADNIQKKVVSEMATGGASSAGGVAVSMGGPGHKPTSGVPKKVGNSYKPKKVSVGKGIY